MARIEPLLGTKTPGSGTGNGILANASGRRLVSIGSDGVGRFLYSLGKVGYLYAPIYFSNYEGGDVRRYVQPDDNLDETTTRDSTRCTFNFSGTDAPESENVDFSTIKAKALSSLATLSSMYSQTERPEVSRLLQNVKVHATAYSEKNLYGDGIGDANDVFNFYCTVSASKSAYVHGDGESRGSSYTASVEKYFANVGAPLLFASCAPKCKVVLPLRLRVNLRAYQFKDGEPVGLPLDIPSLDLCVLSIGTNWDNGCDTPIQCGSLTRVSVQVGIHHPATNSRSDEVYEKDIEIVVEVPQSRLLAVSWDETYLQNYLSSVIDSAQGFETSGTNGDRYFNLDAEARVQIGFTIPTPGVVHPIA